MCNTGIRATGLVNERGAVGRGRNMCVSLLLSLAKQGQAASDLRLLGLCDGRVGGWTCRLRSVG